jgi:hypothetical protein
MASKYWYYRRGKKGSVHGWFTPGRVYRIWRDAVGNTYAVSDGGEEVKPRLRAEYYGVRVWEGVTKAEWEAQEGAEGGGTLDLDDPANAHEALSIAYRIALIVVNDAKMHSKAKETLLDPNCECAHIEGIRKGLEFEEGDYSWYVRKDKPFWLMVTTEVALQLGIKLPPHRLYNAVEVKQETKSTNPEEGNTMKHLNYNLPTATFKRVFGVEVTDLSDDDLMQAIRLARKEVESLQDLKDSTKVAKKIAVIEDGIKELMEWLDA